MSETDYKAIVEVYRAARQVRGDEGPSLCMTTLGTLRHAYWAWRPDLREDIAELIKSELLDDTIIQITANHVGLL